MKAMLALMRRDITLAFRRRGELLTPAVFFILVTTLFPLGLAPRPELLRDIAPGVVWVAALLAALLGQESLFKGDYEDGVLEQLALAQVPMEVQALVRIFTHWLATGLPLVILSPLMAMLLGYPAAAMPVLAFSLLLGTLVLSLLGAIGAALTVSLKQGGLLLPILVLPLTVPALIFGAQAAAQATRGEDPSGGLYLLGAMLVLGVALAPFAIAGALRISLES